MSDPIPVMMSAIEYELKQQVNRLDQPGTQPFHQMLAYHMGWHGEGAGELTTGKRIRPLMLLLCTQASGGNWENALPAAASVELVHNFSLVHDDIQDNSPLRRGRPTVWKKWGAPMAINVGDALFSIASLAINDLMPVYPAETVVQASRLMHDTCLELTRGQFLDMSFESRDEVKPEEYWHMIAGKTSALLATVTKLGALLGNASKEQQNAYQDYGHYLGLAFQILDDILGIWGNSQLTGKSIASDLIERKKTLPVLLGLEKRADFAARWQAGQIRESEVAAVAEMLEREGVRMAAQQAADQMTDLALRSLRIADPQGEAGDLLHAITNQLLQRQT